MSNKTNINAFRQEVEGAVKEAHSSIDEIAKKLENYLTKFHEVTTVSPVITEPNTLVSTEPVSPVNKPVVKQPATNKT